MGRGLRLARRDRGLIGRVFATAVYYGRAVYFLARVYLGHSYKMAPFACEQRDYKIELREWYLKQGKDPEEAEAEFAAWIESQYAEDADYNARSNYDKREYLFRANKAVVTCLILAVLTFLPFAVHRIRRLRPFRKFRSSSFSVTVKKEAMKCPNKTQNLPSCRPRSLSRRRAGNFAKARFRFPRNRFMKLSIELDREDDGRAKLSGMWIAEALELPGVMTYGATREEAISNTARLAIEVIADRMRHGELPASALSVWF